MSIKPRLSLDRNIANDRIEMPYPCVEVFDPSDALALVLLGLPEGDLSVICYVNDALREIRKVKNSSRTLNTLRQISRVTFHKSAHESREIKSAIDAVEVYP